LRFDGNPPSKVADLVATVKPLFDFAHDLTILDHICPLVPRRPGSRSSGLWFASVDRDH
jgi:hypothetical protein